MLGYILLSERLSLVGMTVEDEGGELGSDHNLIWCVVGFVEPKMVRNAPRYKWRVDGRGIIRGKLCMSLGIGSRKCQDWNLILVEWS